MSCIFDRASALGRSQGPASEPMMLQAIRLFIQTEIVKDGHCAAILGAKNRQVRLGLRRRMEFMPR